MLYNIYTLLFLIILALTIQAQAISLLLPCISRRSYSVMPKNHFFRELKTIQDLPHAIKPTMLVLIDIDNTVLTQTNFDATDHRCTIYKYKQLLHDKKNPNNAFIEASNQFNTAQKNTTVMPVEPEVIPIIKNIQNRKIPVFGFTSRTPTLAPITERQLHSLAIKFTDDEYVTSSQACTLNLPYPSLFSRGILYCDHNSKGAALVALINKLQLSHNSLNVDDKYQWLTATSNELALKKPMRTHIALHYTFFHKNKLEACREILKALTAEQQRNLLQDLGFSKEQTKYYITQ